MNNLHHEAMLGCAMVATKHGLTVEASGAGAPTWWPETLAVEFFTTDDVGMTVLFVEEPTGTEYRLRAQVGVSPMREIPLEWKHRLLLDLADAFCDNPQLRADFLREAKTHSPQARKAMAAA